MTRGPRIIVVLVAGLMATAGAAQAQEAAASFEALGGRVKIGELVWVTDSTGAETHGRLDQLSKDGLILEAHGAVTLAAADIRRVRVRDHDSIKNGALIGLGVGAALGSAWCIGAVADDSTDVNAGVECAEGFTVYPGLGALIGLAVDAVIPGKMRVIYQASRSQAISSARILVTPLVRSRAKGLTLLISF